MKKNIFVALDFSNFDKALDVAEQVKNYAAGLKVTNELFAICGKEGLKKLTREELKGAAIVTSEQLIKLKEQLREGKARQLLVEGELKSYSSLYNAISRVITLRTFDKKEYNR